MKKAAVIILMFLTVIILSACENNQDNVSMSDMITTKLKANTQNNTEDIVDEDTIIINKGLIKNDIRQTVMKAAGVSMPLIFDISHNETVKSISIWLDKYEHGKFIEKISGITSYTRETERTATIYTSLRKLDDDILDWTLSIQQGQSLSSGQITTEQKNYSSMGTSILHDVSTKLHTDTSIGYIIFTNKAGISVYQDDQTNIETHDLVYIIKCRFE